MKGNHGQVLSPDGNYAWDGVRWVPNVDEPSTGERGPIVAPERGLYSWAGSLDSVTSEDLYFGQTVIVWARWILIGTGLVLSFWNPGSLGVAVLAVTWAGLVALAMGNFFLHIQLLRGHPSLDTVVYGASLADLVVITALVVAQGGLTSPVFVFYFAAVLGLSVAFPTVLTVVYTASAVFLYGLICLATAGLADDPAIFVRLLMIAAIAVCGNLFARNERRRREDASVAHAELLEEIKQPAGDHDAVAAARS